MFNPVPDTVPLSSRSDTNFPLTRKKENKHGPDEPPFSDSSVCHDTSPLGRHGSDLHPAKTSDSEHWRSASIAGGVHSTATQTVTEATQ